MTIHHGIKLGFLPSTQSRTDLGVVRVSSALNYFYFFFKKIYLFIYLTQRERERDGRGERVGERDREREEVF